MIYKKFLGAASAALMILIVLTLVLAPAAGAANKYKVLHAFNGSDGSTPYAGLIFDAAGNLYGTTGGGGVDVNGNVFKLNPNADESWTERVLHTFNGSDGAEPIAGLVFDAVGNLYGTTASGGAHGAEGTVFKLTPNADGSWTERVLHSFNILGGSHPYAGLIFDAAGNLYGTTVGGGNLGPCGGYGCGVVFKLTPNADGSWTESVLHWFNGSDGESPESGLIFDAAGNLYGTTGGGGNNGRLCGGYGCGVVFKLTPNADGSWTESVLHYFKGGSDGEFPYASLIFDAAGNLYGTTQGDGANNQMGTVFKLTPNADGSWTESVLHSFNSDLGVPLAGLIFDGAGNLYGTASSFGSFNDGAAFKLSPNLDGSWAYSLIHVFQGKPALTPYGGLVLGSAGTFYGTTAYCSSGSGCAGVVYQITQ